MLLLGHIGGISPLWLSYVFALMRGKSSTCDQDIRLYLHVEKLSVKDIPYSFFFPKPHSYHHHAVFHRILTRQGRIDASVLVWWMHSVFRAYGVFYAGSLPSVVAGSNGLCHSQVIRHSTNGHRAVLHRILSRQCRVDTRTLARWMYNIFCIYGVPRGNFLPLAARHLIGYQLFLLLP